MVKDYEFNWYGKQATLQLENATADVLAKAAFQIEAHTKVNISQNGQVDTGFMRATVYAIPPDDADPISGLETFEQARANAGGLNPDAEMGNKPSVPPISAAVGVGASYSIFQEVKKPFLFPALKQTQRQVGGIIEEVVNEKDLR